MNTLRRYLPFALLGGLLPGCDTAPLSEDAGFETGQCIEGACFEGLECLSDLCVDDGEGQATGGPGPGTGLPPGSGGDDGPATASGPDPSASASGGDDDGGASDGGADDGGTSDDGGTGDDGGADDGGADDGGADDGGADDGGADDGGTGFDPGEPCDVYQQDCPDGAKCNPWSDNGGSNWNALGCFPVDASPDQPGEVCTVQDSGVSGYDSCDVGSMCWDVDPETNFGVCVAMCEGSPAAPTCDDASASCTIANDGVINLCLPGCDPLVQACPGGQGCYPVDDTFVCAPDASGDGGDPGDACQFVNSCGPGNACIQGAVYGPTCGTNCCSPFCDIDNPGACPEPSQECTAWFAEGEAPPALDSVGICAVP